MINIDELKPILSELLGDREDQATFIERITALDKPSETPANSDDAIKELNKQWEERFRNAFFKNEGLENKQETKQYNSPAGGDTPAPEQPLTYEALFTKKGE